MRMGWLCGAVLVGLGTVPVAGGWGQDARLKEPGPGPYGVKQVTFTAHHVATDHAEGVTTMDVNGDGRPDLLSGAYWYENPGPTGGEWVRHQYREVGLHGEFISDCGEWAVDVNHDGRMDVVSSTTIATAGAAGRVATMTGRNPLECGGLFAVGRRPVMWGIRDRIAGLRTRALTAPERVEGLEG